jgi:large subunit ribosomal protein L30
MSQIISQSELLNKKIIVTQVKGGSKLNIRQKGNLIGLGLRGIGTKATLPGTPSILGMIKKVEHIVKVAIA